MIKKGITSIGDNAFRNFKNLKEIRIPSTVKKIGCYSFYRTALKEITVPATVKTIGQCAFYQIEGLEKLTMPGKFHLKTKKGEKAKYYLAVGMGTVIFNTPLDLETAGMMSAQNFIVSEKDPNYKSIQGVIYSKDGKSIVRMPLGRRELVIQEGCEEFCLQSVLYCCKDLSSDSANEAYVRHILIPSSIKTIESQKYKTHEIPLEIPEILTLDIQTDQLTGDSIAELVERFHTELKELKRLLPESIYEDKNLYITKDGVLLGYTGKGTKVVIPDGVRKIAEYAFAYCNITEIQIPDSVKRIGEEAFRNDKALEEIVLGKNVQDVARTAFWNIPSKNITIHGSSKGIANEAFNRSCNLTYTESATEMKAMFSFWYSSITKGKQPKVKMILDWSKITGADGYQIIIAQDKKFKTNKRTLTAAKSKKRIHVTYNLEEKKTDSIYAKIRPYKMQKGKKLYGRWTLQSTINPI